MSPQHSFLPGRSSPFGTTTQVYMRMECYNLHIHAIFNGVSNAINSSFRYGYSPVNLLVQYCFHCFLKWLIYIGQHLAWVIISCCWQQLAQATTRHLLNPPGDPPWCKFTNYLKTKNRPFINPFSWTVPATWRSPERKSFYHFLTGGTNRLRNWFRHGCRNLPTIKQYQNKG
jgi:hypothetical protein